MKIKVDREYTPNEIIDMGLMWQKTRDTQSQMLHRFIRQGRLPVRNIGTHLQPRYIIRGSNLIEFIKKYGTKKTIGY